jgi:phospholipid/cholesterol/gamma-HCH transport system substrate-binding protein
VTAIKKNLGNFIAIIALILISAGVSLYILSNQRLRIPFLQPKPFTLKAEFSTAQAVVAGQGQTVRVAGVRIGDIGSVSLKDGHAVVSMKVDPKYKTLVHTNATALLRPKTGLKDMFIDLQPGGGDAPVVKPGFTIPIRATQPDVNPDEILGMLDTDTRDYLQLLLNDGAQGIGGPVKGRQLAAAIRRIQPTAKYSRQINEGLALRRRNLARVVHNFSLLADELGKRDTQLAGFVQNSNAVFASLANQDAALRSTLQKLPGALNTTQTALGKVDAMATELGPTLEALRPGARALGPSLRQTRPFLRQTTPIIRDELRPFARAALPTVKQLRPAMRDLAAATPDLTASFKVDNRLLNEIAYNPPGKQDEGYLFWQAWVNHAGDSLFSSQDAHGPIRRGLIVLSCQTAQVLSSVTAANPQLATLIGLLNSPTTQQICPTTTQSPVGGG